MSAADCLQFRVTPHIRDACKQCLAALSKSRQKSPDLAQIVAIGTTGSTEQTTISLASVKGLSQELLKAGESNAWVHQLLRGSKIHIEQPQPTPRNPELVARLDKIKRQLEEHEYQRMTVNVMPHGFKGTELLPAVPGVRTGQASGVISMKQELRDANKTISVIINIIFSALGVGFAVGYASYTLTSELGWRVLMALGAALITILAETWLFVFSASRGQKQRLQLKPRATS
ncbi:hypothetical protein EV176_004394 [Coemansia sp. RSA 451]|nr:hypothetical protein EV176_004394 [Coemansia sp. RSA 451]